MENLAKLASLCWGILLLAACVTPGNVPNKWVRSDTENWTTKKLKYLQVQLEVPKKGKGAPVDWGTYNDYRTKRSSGLQSYTIEMHPRWSGAVGEPEYTVSFGVERIPASMMELRKQGSEITEKIYGTDIYAGDKLYDEIVEGMTTGIADGGGEIRYYHFARAFRCQNGEVVMAGATISILPGLNEPYLDQDRAVVQRMINSVVILDP